MDFLGGMTSKILPPLNAVRAFECAGRHSSFLRAAEELGTLLELRELVEAAPGFGLVVSYNPGYQNVMKDLKPSTRQRFVALDFDFPPTELEVRIVRAEGEADEPTARALVALGHRIRKLHDKGLTEVPSTRLLVATARLIARGVAPADACAAALIGPLSDDPDLVAAMRELVAATLV